MLASWWSLDRDYCSREKVIQAPWLEVNARSYEGGSPGCDSFREIRGASGKQQAASAI